MNLAEVNRALRQLRVSGMASTLESRIVQAQADHWAPLDLVSALVQDELQRRQDRLLDRRVKRAGFRDVGKTLDTFDFDFNRKLDRRLVFELAAGHFIAKHEDALFLGPPGTGKSHLAQGIGHAVIQQGHKVLYREAHLLLEELAEATIDGTRRELLNDFATVPLLVIDDLGMRKLPATAAEHGVGSPAADPRKQYRPRALASRAGDTSCDRRRRSSARAPPCPSADG